MKSDVMERSGSRQSAVCRTKWSLLKISVFFLRWGAYRASVGYACVETGQGCSADVEGLSLELRGSGFGEILQKHEIVDFL